MIRLTVEGARESAYFRKWNNLNIITTTTTTITRPTTNTTTN